MIWDYCESLHLLWAKTKRNEEGILDCTGSIGSLHLFWLLKYIAVLLFICCVHPTKYLIYDVSRVASSETSRCQKWAQQSVLHCTLQ